MNMEPEKTSRLSLYNNRAKLVESRGNFSHNQYIYESDFRKFEEKPSPRENKIWKLVCHRFFWVLSVTTATTTGVYFWSLNQIPVYQGTFQILVERVIAKNSVNNQFFTFKTNLFWNLDNTVWQVTASNYLCSI